MFKKLVCFLMIIACTFSCLPVISSAASYSVANIDFSAEFDIFRYTGSGSNATIDLEFDMGVVSYPELSSSDTIVFDTFVESTPHMALIAGIFSFKFPSAEYLQGQTYNFSFKLNGTQNSNTTGLYILPSEPDFQLAVLINYETYNNWYDIGDKIPSFSAFTEKALLFEFLDMKPLASLSKSLWHNSIMRFQ